MKARIVSDGSTSLFPSASTWDVLCCPAKIGHCQPDHGSKARERQEPGVTLFPVKRPAHVQGAGMVGQNTWFTFHHPHPFQVYFSDCVTTTKHSTYTSLLTLKGSLPRSPIPHNQSHRQPPPMFSFLEWSHGRSLWLSFGIKFLSLPCCCTY